jgi:hypothetical protein
MVLQCLQIGGAKWAKRNTREIQDQLEWITPDFVKIKQKQLSPYNESEIWERQELLTIVKYEPYLRNRAILTLMWDLNARPTGNNTTKNKAYQTKR